jgi:hypothetical protein
MGGFALEQETLDGVVVLVFAEPGDGALQPAGLGTEDVGAPRVALVKSEPELELLGTARRSGPSCRFRQESGRTVVYRCECDIR